jgi:hypothetical protein
MPAGQLPRRSDWPEGGRLRWSYRYEPGPWDLQRKLLAIVDASEKPIGTLALVLAVYDERPISESHRVTVRRALAGLEKRGYVGRTDRVLKSFRNGYETGWLNRKVAQERQAKFELLQSHFRLLALQAEAEFQERVRPMLQNKTLTQA